MKRAAWIVGLLLLAAGVGLGVWWLRTPAGPRDVVPRRTAVVPTLDTPIPEGKSALWCASFQLAWEHLKKDVTKGPVELDGAEDVARRLNDAGAVADTLLAEDYYSAAGFMRDGIAGKIRAEMAERFPDVSPPSWGSDTIAGAFAYLRASLKFTHRYMDHKEPLTFTGGDGKKTRVYSFGFPYRSQGAAVRQLEVLHNEYEGEGVTAVVDPCKDSSPYQLLLAMQPRRATLAAALADMEQRVKTKPHRFGGLDAFFVPRIGFRLSHRFEELEGRAIPNVGEPAYLSRAEQRIEFRLDATGATLESRAELQVAKKGGAPELYFDRPFLVVMSKRGARAPFFVLWVENDDLLEPW